jgi:hypothetical protein
VLRIQNGWLQWLQNVQKPLAGLFRHLVWPKNEEVTPPGSFPLQACCTCSPKRTCQLIWRCHMVAHEWATRHHIIFPKNDTCHQIIHPSATEPTELAPTHLPCHCMVVRPVFLYATSSLYGLYGQQKKLCVWQNEQNAISCSYGVFFIMFKFCWVRNDGAYAHVHVKVILRTFIFEKNLFPWIIHVPSCYL